MLEYNPTYLVLINQLDHQAMKTRSRTCILRVATTLCALHSASLMADLTPAHEISVTRTEIERVRTSLEGYGDASEKIRFLQRTLAQTTNSSVRQEALAMGEAVGGDEFESLLIGVVNTDRDVEMRISATKLLAKHGTSRSIQVLLNCARSDPTGEFQRGCMVGQTNSRRDAYFALAELGLRLPSERERIATAVRGIPVTSESDTQTTVLYILTGDQRLLRPFYERFASADVKTRVSGITAFRFLKLKRAPKELTELIHDSELEIRLWVALVLGEIGDPKTIPVLMDAAENKEVDSGTRCNAIGSLGQMRAAEATVLLQRLLSDEAVKINAAIALSKITKKRHPLVPRGYILDCCN